MKDTEDKFNETTCVLNHPQLLASFPLASFGPERKIASIHKYLACRQWEWKRSDSSVCVFITAVGL
jgi:hypothetical protein